MFVGGAAIAVALLLAACAETPKPPPSTPGGGIRRRNEGYSLLYQLMKDESDVAKILIIKSADPAVAGIVKEVAAFAQSTKKQLDEFAKADKQLEFDVPDLPHIEQDSRDLTAKTVTKSLLGSSGKVFQQRLVFSQAEAMSYAAHLAKALLSYEDNADRKKFLTDFAQRATDLHDRLSDLLTIKS
jgi:hypothetical protein